MSIDRENCVGWWDEVESDDCRLLAPSLVLGAACRQSVIAQSRPTRVCREAVDVELKRMMGCAQSPSSSAQEDKRERASGEIHMFRHPNADFITPN